eukprot:1192707-Prymnesium_polylepis.1
MVMRSPETCPAAFHVAVCALTSPCDSVRAMVVPALSIHVPCHCTGMLTAGRSRLTQRTALFHRTSP